MAPRRGNARWIVGVLALSVALFFLFPKTQNRPLSLIETPFVWLATTITGAVERMGTAAGDFWTNYVDLHDARIEARALAAERDQLLARLAERDEAMRETERLRTLLVLQRESSLRTVSARVVGGDVSRWFRSFQIDKGSRDGVKAGDGVIAPLGVVGRVVMVTRTTAQVLGVNNRGCIIPARLHDSRLAGILQGGPRPASLPEATARIPLIPANLAELKYIPRSANVNVGDRVVTSGLEGHFPPGIPVGTVAGVVRERSEMFAKVYVTPEVSFATLEEVLVVVGPGPAAEGGG
ncbi:MAG: rod shape-determining protein MreC [Nitrospirae bacterium]|nr:rod shape-determining protein MreC [Nitrospirota bacterium]